MLKCYSTKIVRLMPATLIFFVCAFLLRVTFEHVTFFTNKDLFSLSGFLFFAVATTLYLILWIFYLRASHYILATLPVLPALKEDILKRGLTAFTSSFLFSMICYIASILVLPAFYVLIVFWYYPLRVAIDNHGARESLGHSYYLVSKQWWQVFRHLFACLLTPFILYVFLRAMTPLAIHTPIDILFFLCFMPWMGIVTLYSYRYFHHHTAEKDIAS